MLLELLLEPPAEKDELPILEVGNSEGEFKKVGTMPLGVPGTPLELGPDIEFLNAELDPEAEVLEFPRNSLGGETELVLFDIDE